MKTARVTEEHKTNYTILDSGKEFTATVRGSFFDRGVFPKVGDFVIYEEVANKKATIEEILPRTSTISRKAVETGAEQIIVTNVDIIFIVMGLDGDFNVSRLERYLLLAAKSGVKPIVVLNKSDSVDNPGQYISSAAEVVGDVPIHAVSALSGSNMDLLLQHFSSDTTAVLLGSSGAGKSTITNWLLGTKTQTVHEVREDDSREKHTTTSRQLFTLPSGGYLIDTPGMRELSILDTAAEDENAVFTMFAELSSQCQFSKCDHEKSMGCAVLRALESGEVSGRQLQNYQKLQKERIFKENKSDEHLSRQRQKDLHKMYRGKSRKKKFNTGY